MRRLCKYQLLLLALLALSDLIAQPCLSGWNYRRMVTFNYSGSHASDIPVLFTLDLNSLVNAGKLRFDGADLRILDADGNHLKFWLENPASAASGTKIWVRLPELTAGVENIYVFYGNAYADAVSSGESTFTFFDDFASLDNTKWTTCGNGDARAENGRLILEVENGGEIMLTSRTLTSPDHVVESDIFQVDGSEAFVGLKKGPSAGYVLNYSSQGGNPTMRMKVFTGGTECINLRDQAPSSLAADAFSVKGLWSFQWAQTGDQKMDWPGSLVHPAVRSDNSHSSPANLSVVAGAQDVAGRLSLNWIRARKKIDSPPSFTVEVEEAIGVNAVASSNSPVCEGETLSLSVTGFAGASYQWSGPGGFVSDQQNPTLLNVNANRTGTYQAVISGSGSCGSITTSVDVVVNETSQPGILAGETSVCSENNAGEVVLSGATGEVVRWESSLTGNEPWSTINNQSTTLRYFDLNTSTSYRSVVKNGACAETITAPVRIDVSEMSMGGAISGDRDVCAVENEAGLFLSGYKGDILGWQSSVDNFATHTDINETRPTLNINDIPVSTSYRAIVKNGACATAYSEAFQVVANPLPDVSFSAQAVCNQQATVFQNTTRISHGFITNHVWDFGDGNNSVSKSPEHIFKTHGDYRVSLMAISNKGCIDSTENTVAVYPLPHPEFSFADACSGEDISFTNQTTVSSGFVAGYQWDFKDGGFSPETSPEHSFSTPGTYEVSLTATSDRSCVDSVIHNVEVYPRSEVDFSFENICHGQAAQFINNSTVSAGSLLFEWRFGDGSTSSAINPRHEYTSSGEYQVTLVAKTAASCTDEINKTIVVYPSPVAAFSVDDVCLQDSAAFQNESFLSSGAMVSYWEYGDGRFSYEDTPRYKYSKPGIYRVALTVSSENNCKSDVSKTITVHSQPEASFVANPVCDKESMAFNNLSKSETEALSFTWLFGDGAQSLAKAPHHLYDSAGIYEATLIALSSFGCSDTIKEHVEVRPLPEPAFDAPGVCDGEAMKFFNASVIKTGHIKSYSWNFGDGTMSSLENPTKLYLNARSYQATLTATSDKNCANSISKQVSVHPIPVASFTAENVCLGYPVFFNNRTSDFGRSAFEWSFGDGAASTEISPSHTFEAPGEYQVKLKLLSPDQCADSITRQVKVYAPAFTSISSDTTISKGYPVRLRASGGVKYLWEPVDRLDNSDVPDPVAVPDTTTTYSVIITDANQCRTIETATVHVVDDFKIIPANVITPDGNGSNDVWKIWNIENYPDNEVSVYNRWGQKVFSEKGYNNDWYGVNGHDILPDGTYYYIIKFNSSSEVYTGAISILRNKK